MFETLTEMFKWSILLPLCVLMMMIIFIGVFFAFSKVLDFLCTDRKLYTRHNPEQFWGTEYFQGYGTLIGRLNGRIVIFNNDRSQYKFVDEKEFLVKNPNAYSPDNPYLVWGKDRINRWPQYVAKRLPVL